jgi:PBP1b-binding outer membrane lipoprotein LpoB
MKIMKIIHFSCTALIILLSGCSASSPSSSSRMAVLQNPETKQTVQCKIDPWGSMNHAMQIENCIKVYEKAGYKKIADTAEP